MNNINYPIITELPAVNDLKNIDSERLGLIPNVGLIRRKIGALLYGKLGGKIKLAFGIIYFFSLMYFTFILMT